MSVSQRLSCWLFGCVSSLSCACIALAAEQPSASQESMRRPAASLALEGVQVAWGGRARFDLERGFAEAFGLVEQGGGSWNAAADRWLLEVRLDPDSFLEMRLLGRSFEGFQGGSLRLQQAPVLRTAAGRAVALEGLSLVPGESGPRSLGLVDGAGQALFHLDYLHYWMHQQPDRVEVRNANLQVGAALALALGHPELEGTVAGVFGFESPADFAGVDAQPLGSCSDPVWPGTGGTVTDVAFTSLGTQAPSFLNSCVGTCTGSSPNARVFWAPNATLANAGTADVPWWEWISPSGATTPRPNEPPYGNHQHPLLIWNMYRIDGQGRLDQIGRSGLKHAYFTVNHDCGCPGGNILWAAPNSVHGVGCGDVYSSASNNESRRLGPRSEIVPVHAVWGRCGSLWDPQCEGIAKDHGIGVPAHRMLVRESDMAPSLNPGASFYLEAWYLVRDDVDIYNTMRNARGSATWTGSAWTNFVYEVGSHLSGPVIDRWVAAGTTQADAMSRELATAEGHARLAVRVTDAGGGLFRYDYAWMNFDFSRAVTQGSEPNLRVLSSRGFDRFSLPLSSSTGVSQAEAVDGAGLVAAWQWSRGGCTAAWTAPADTATLDWGGMMRFSLIASAAPVTVTARIRVHEPGTPSEFEIETLGPDAQSVYCDGFEQAPLVSLARNTSL